MPALQLRLKLLFIEISCVFTMDFSHVNAQEQPRISYEIVIQLPITQASQVSWSPDGTRLAITAFPTIQIWDTQTWKLLQTISDTPAYSTKWSPNGDMLAGVRGGDGETLLIWDAKTGQLLKEMTRSSSPDPKEELPPIPYVKRGGIIVHTLAWHPDGKRIATDSGQLDKDMLLIWNWESDDPPQSLATVHTWTSAGNLMNVGQLEWSHNGQWLLSAGGDGNFRSRAIIRLWDATTGRIVRTIFPGFNPIWGPTDAQFAGLTLLNEVYVINIWNTETGEVLSTFTAHDKGVFELAWHYAANVIAGIALNNHLNLWDVETGMQYDIEDVYVSLPSRNSIAWQPNGNQLAIADMDSGVTIIRFEFDR